MSRPYRLGRREAAVASTRQAILAAARELVSAGPDPSLGAVAAKAGVSRITVYNQFGTRAGLLAALAPRHEPPMADPHGSAREQLSRHLAVCCDQWVAEPALYRNLPRAARHRTHEAARRLAESLAQSDELRPGCSLKEAEDVIAMLTSFSVFDHLHKDGRRSAPAVASILERLASALLT